MNTIENDVLSALQTATINAVAASLVPTLAVKALMRNFEIPDDHKYLEIVWIPNNITNQFWGEEKTYRGLLRLLLHWPLDDAGAYPPIIALQSVADHFAKGATFRSGQATVQIYENPDFMSPIYGDSEVLLPVSIRYMCFRS